MAADHELQVQHKREVEKQGREHDAGVVKMNVRQPVKFNVSDKWHRPIAMRTF